MQPKFEFIDMEEGDTIVESSDNEVVAHSGDVMKYLRQSSSNEESEYSDDPSRLPPSDLVEDTYGIDVDLRPGNGIADDYEEYDVGVGDHGVSNNIETRLGPPEEIPVDVLVDLSIEERKSGDSGVDDREILSEVVVDDGDIDKVKTLSVGVEEEKNENEEDEMEDVEADAELKDVNVESNDDTGAETDPLIVDESSKNENSDKIKAKAKLVSAGTQSHELQPLLVSPSQSPPPPDQKKFKPREHPGKAVKSRAIGTDKVTPNREHPKEPPKVWYIGEKQETKKSRSDANQRHNLENGNRAPPSKGKKAGSPMTHNPRPKAKPRDRAESPRDRAVHSSDAKFFKSRLSQTSKRYPNRHVWLVRDSEIHRMIAEKATILRRHNKENGRKGNVTSMF